MARVSDNLFAAEAILRFDDVSLAYGRNDPTLRKVSFSLKPGSFHFITGASGAGKSSLLKLIYMAVRPTGGRIELFGHDIARISSRDLPLMRRRIGVVFQDFRLLDHMTVFDNAAVPLRITGLRPESYRNDVAELLSWVGMGERMHVLPPTLAGGEKQRLAIARAVVARPEIILADEPTGNLDADMSQRILKLFSQLNRLGTTVLIATHDQGMVERSGMPVLHLENGRLVSQGPGTRP